MKMTKGINGKVFGRALSYALKACPRGDVAPQLQHIAFIGNRVIGADGRRWHVGLLPPGIAAEPMVITRTCAMSMIRSLRYAQRESTASDEFSVSFNGTECVIDFGAQYPIAKKWSMAPHGVGAMPTHWADPVPASAPIHTGNLAGYPADHMQAATEWYKSWEKHYGTAAYRSHGDGGPMRIEVTSGGDAVVVAFVLPADVPAAVLPADEPLLRDKGRRPSQTVLDLMLVGDRLAAPVAEPDPEVPGAVSEKVPRSRHGLGTKGKKRAKLHAVPTPGDDDTTPPAA